MMKKKKVVFVISGVLLAIAIIVLAIYINRKNQFTNSVEVEIKPDREVYSPYMSSTVGIGLTPEYTLDRPLRNVRFHWTTDYGYFISWSTADYKVHVLESDITIGPEKIYWSYSPEKVNEEKPPVKITLKIEDVQTGKTLAETTLDIGWESVGTAKIIDY